jgi:hypothetical protein
MTILARSSLITTTTVVALALGGCAGAPATGTTAAASGGGGGGARPDPDQQQKITQCLQAAGLPVPSFAPRPSRDPATPPTRRAGLKPCRALPTTRRA